jgi:DNA polymerase-3 subunit beta
MKITVSRRDLHPALVAVSRIVESRTTIPILSNIALEAADGRLVLRGTDLDIEARAGIDATIDVPGALTLSAGRLRDIVGKLDDGPVSISSSSEMAGTAKIRAGRAKFDLGVLPIVDFPDLSAGTPTHSFGLPGDVLAAGLEAVAFAISTEETRYYLNGTFMHVTDGRLILVATDGHRLSKWSMPAPDGAEGMPGVIVPRKTCGEIVKLAKGDPRPAALALDASKIRVEAGDTILVSKLIDGTFPDYGRVIPAIWAGEATIDRTEMAAVVDRVATVQSQRGNAVKLGLADGRLTVSVTDPDTGHAEEEIAAEIDEGFALEIGFNGRYLAAILASLDGERVTMRLTDAGSPSIFVPAAPLPAAADRLVVLMPMRV